MKIALIGHGKMGRAVEQAALTRGHEIVCVIDVDNQEDFNSEAFRSADVAMEFTTPKAALANFHKCWATGLPVVSGSTGWQNELVWDEVHAELNKGATMLWAPNFSIGLNVTQAASRLLAHLLNPYKSYHASVHEVHHVHKLDHPSGSAILLAGGIVEEHSRYDVWAEQTAAMLPDNALPITHERIGEVAGVHTVTWDSAEDTITLTHEAKGREGFATGAVVAAEWLLSAPKGHLYNMSDVLNSLAK